jgi:hypothetical protein
LAIQPPPSSPAMRRWEPGSFAPTTTVPSRCGPMATRSGWNPLAVGPSPWPWPGLHRRPHRRREARQRLQHAVNRRAGAIDPQVLHSHRLTALQALQALGRCAGKEGTLARGCSVGELPRGAQATGRSCCNSSGGARPPDTVRSPVDLPLPVERGSRTRLSHPRYVQRRSWLRSGSERMRLPVILKMALHTAGAIGGTPGSPMPPTSCRR